MTIEKLIRILRENDIPEDAILRSDSGWECWESDMDGVYYCAKTNIVIFTQDYDVRKYNDDPDYVKLALKEEWIFTNTFFDDPRYMVECPSCHKKWKTHNELKWRKENKLCPNCGIRKEIYE